VPFDDVDAVDKAITDKTAAVMVEPIQGEAGVLVPREGYLDRLHDVCKRKGVLLICDEVQTGNGRTGKYFAFQHSDIKPDIVTLAKGLANGIPIGACISDYGFTQGEHGSTFGGNCVSSVAAIATIEYIEKNDLMANADAVGSHFMSALSKLPKVKAVRGKGLIIGVEIDADAKAVSAAALTQGLLVNSTDERTLRFLPPLNVTKAQANKAARILGKVLKNV